MNDKYISNHLKQGFFKIKKEIEKIKVVFGFSKNNSRNKQLWVVSLSYWLTRQSAEYQTFITFVTG